eukprot:3752378-Amphidinium_carterae.2
MAPLGRESVCDDWCESVLSLLERLSLWHRTRVCNHAMWMEGGAAVTPGWAPRMQPAVFMEGRTAARPSASLFRMRRLYRRNQRVEQDPRWRVDLRIHHLQQSRPGMRSRSHELQQSRPMLRRFLPLLSAHVAAFQEMRAGSPGDPAAANTASGCDER